MPSITQHSIPTLALADLEGSAEIAPEHAGEALQNRMLDRCGWRKPRLPRDYLPFHDSVRAGVDVGLGTYRGVECRLRAALLHGSEQRTDPPSPERNSLHAVAVRHPQ